eukprot:m.42717 g.42717  ORF g.42717 m.42717 type:complete len:472 (-) comp5739_c0_seq1:3692-5107(-)
MATAAVFAHAANGVLRVAADAVTGLVPLQEDGLVGLRVVTPDDPAVAAARALLSVPPATPDDAMAARAVACMVGMAVGDAIGAPLEFLPVRYRPAAEHVITDMGTLPRGKFFLLPGQYTDDTSMGLCLADSLLSTGGVFCPGDLMLRFAGWCVGAVIDHIQATSLLTCPMAHCCTSSLLPIAQCMWATGYNNAFCNDHTRPTRHSVGLGGNISESIYLFMRTGFAYTRAGDCATSGNGGIMRLGAIAAAFHDDMAQAEHVAALQSRTTHQGFAAQEAARLLAHTLVRLVRAPSRAVLDDLAGSFVTEEPNVHAIARSAATKGDPNSQWNWKDPGHKYHAGRAAQQPGYIGSFSLDALAMAFHCVYTTQSFTEAVLKAVNLCGDADSVGAVTGQLAGALYGAGCIPADWLAAIEQWDNGTIAARALRLYRKELLSGTTCRHTPFAPPPALVHHARMCTCRPAPVAPVAPGTA